MPEEQVRQLADVGLDVVVAMNAAGDQIDWRVPQSDHWLHYLCRIARNSV
jgi:isopentenyl diphosphate isomerase/L-lactate dehydrogenase-like FMN-dependent dehydrogenase